MYMFDRHIFHPTKGKKHKIEIEIAASASARGRRRQETCETTLKLFSSSPLPSSFANDKYRKGSFRAGLQRWNFMCTLGSRSSNEAIKKDDESSATFDVKYF